MKDFKIKLDIYKRLDDHVWDVFDAFITQNCILFSDPQEWSVGNDCIYFSGRDGCRGSYDHRSITIPLECFKNTEEEEKPNKNLFDKKNRYTNDAKNLVRQTRSLITPSFKEHIKMGYKPQEIAHIISGGCK